MNKNRHFDEHIKTQFGDYTPAVPPHVWENIMAKKDRKRPAGFWVSLLGNRNKLLLAGLIVALTSGGALLYYSNTAPVQKAAADYISENKTPDNKAQQIRDIQTEPATPASTSVSGVSEKQPSAAGDAYPAYRKTAATNGNTNIRIASAQTETDGNTTYTSIGTKKKNKKYYTGLANDLVNITAPETEEESYAEQGGTLLGRLSYNAEKITLKRKTSKQETLRFNPVVFLPDCPAVEKDASGNKRYFEFFAGPDYAFRSLQDTGNSGYLQKRKESTHFKSGFSAGIRYTKVFNNSMSVRTGATFSQINEKFSYNQGNVVQVTYIINNNGDTIGSYTTTGTRYKTTINRYRSIDIPLVLGYEVGNGKLHANINAGAVVNVYSWQKGDVLDAAGNPVSITTGKSSSPYQFKTNAGVGFIGAVSVYYKLNNRLHLMAEPYFRYNLSQMNKQDITLKQKYHTAGLRLGIRLDLK